MAKISIAMATYNGGKHLDEQLNSFINQTRKPDELVVVDDCSTDDTLSKLNEFKRNSIFPVIIVQNKENLGNKNKYGFANNFETAIKLCSGDIVFLSDQDDVWFPEKIERHIEIYDNNSNIMMISNNAIRTYSNLFNYNLTQIDYGKIGWGGDGKVSIGCCYSFRYEMLSYMLPIPKNIAHDVWFYCFVEYIFGGRYDIVEPLQYFRRSSSAWSAINEGSNSVTVLQCYFSKYKRYFNYIFKNNNAEYINTYLYMIKELQSRLLINFELFKNKTAICEKELLNKVEYLKKLIQLYEYRKQILKISNIFLRIKPILRLYKFNDLYSKSNALKDLLSNTFLLNNKK